MARSQVLLLALFVATGALAHDGMDRHHRRVGIRERQKLRYTIEKKWDGSDIDHPQTPATVEVSLTCHGDIKLDVSAPFYNSPHPEEHRVALHCPHRHVYGLWRQEVIEVYFVNDQDEYFSLLLSPRGRYLGMMHKGYRRSALVTVPEHNIPVEVHNPCLDENTDAIDGCKKIWSATTIVPREYLPPNVTLFNAHFTHGNKWGVAEPEESMKTYESLYPQGDGASQPDYHHLSTFQHINLTVLGYLEMKTYSPIWRHALGKYDKTFWYENAI